MVVCFNTNCRGYEDKKFDGRTEYDFSKLGEKNLMPSEIDKQRTKAGFRADRSYRQSGTHQRRQQVETLKKNQATRSSSTLTQKKPPKLTEVKAETHRGQYWQNENSGIGEEI